jgi:hypothetical protein
MGRPKVGQYGITYEDQQCAAKVSTQGNGLYLCYAECDRVGN